MDGIAACMKTGNYEEGFAVDNEKERIGETMEQGSTDIFVDDGELTRVRTHALNEFVNSITEPSS
jgi:hypothetical protein